MYYPRKGKFIVFEGTDGAGKTYQSVEVAAKLQQLGRKVHLFREPGGTEAGEILRDLAKNPAIPLNSYAQLLVMMASRAQLVMEKLLPALNRGEWVISDRYTPSSIAYRPDIPKSTILQITELLGFPAPNLYIFLTADAATLRDRASQKGQDRFDNDENAEMRIHAYEKLCIEFNGVLIKSDGAPAKTTRTILDTIIGRMNT